MDYPQHVWDQLKNITVEKLMNALEKDGWERDPNKSAKIPFRKSDENGELLNRVVIHYHPKKTYGKKLLKGLFTQIGWSVEDLEGLKLIKHQSKR